MSFNENIREEALVRSGRRCCVCHKFCGLKIEVHHIIHQNEGGDDSLDNAIALCFDCHSDAGHYNKKHPKGSKYSPNELRRHRDEWYAFVEKNKTLDYYEPEKYLVQYFRTSNIDFIEEIAKGNFRGFPLNNVILLDNDVRRFQRSYCFQSINHSEEYNSVEDYEEKYPGECYQAIDEIAIYKRRIVSDKRVAMELEQNYLYKLLYNNAVAFNDLYDVYFCEQDGCRKYTERWEGKYSISAIYLVIQNISGESQLLSVINARTVSSSRSAMDFKQLRQANRGKVQLPKMRLQNGGTLVIPIITSMQLNSDEKSIVETIVSSNESLNGNFHDIYLSQNISENLNKCLVVGPAIYPEEIIECDYGIEKSIPVHELDFFNMYIHSEYWDCGSCPHIFLMMPGKAIYLGEVFAEKGETYNDFFFRIPDGICKFFMFELEDEITTVEWIAVNDHIVFERRTLNRGECLSFDVLPGDIVSGRGYYELLNKDGDQITILEKTKRIKYIMDEISTSYYKINDISSANQLSPTTLIPLSKETHA